MQLVGVNLVPTRDLRHTRARHKALLDNPSLMSGRPPSPALATHQHRSRRHACSLICQLMSKPRTRDSPKPERRRSDAYVLFLGGAFPHDALADGHVQQLTGEWQRVYVANGPAKICVFFAGTGPTIVMLPGQGRGPVALEPVAHRLVAAGFRIVLPEPRGYGESVGPLEGVTLRDLGADVARAIESVGGAPVFVAGHAY